MKIGNLEVINLLGKIDKENIFIGNIMECEKCEYYSFFEAKEDGRVRFSFGPLQKEFKLFKENVLLIKIINSPIGYVALDDINCRAECKNVYKLIKNNGFVLDKMIMSNVATHKGEKIVDEESLKPYYENEKGKIKVKQMKKDLLIDPRIRGGIEH